MAKNHKIEILLVISPGVLNYNDRNFFEVKPNRKSPIFVNLKKTLSNVTLRNILTANLLKNLPSNIDFICGIESGGSYYASVIADKLRKPIVLYRKNDKKYAEKGDFVGAIPSKRDKVLVIDDVIVSGSTIDHVIQRLKELGCEIYVHTIFSYGNNDIIKKRFEINIYSLITMTNFLQAAKIKKILTQKDVTFLKNFILRQRKEFILKFFQQ